MREKGIMELIAYGLQDMYLTSTPQIVFKKIEIKNTGEIKNIIDMNNGYVKVWRNGYYDVITHEEYNTEKLVIDNGNDTIKVWKNSHYEVITREEYNSSRFTIDNQ